MPFCKAGSHAHMKTVIQASIHVFKLNSFQQVARCTGGHETLHAAQKTVGKTIKGNQIQEFLKQDNQRNMPLQEKLDSSLKGCCTKVLQTLHCFGATGVPSISDQVIGHTVCCESSCLLYVE